METNENKVGTHQNIYLNQFHKETTEQMLRRIAEWKNSPTSCTIAAERMKQNLILGQLIEENYMASKMGSLE